MSFSFLSTIINFCLKYCPNSCTKQCPKKCPKKCPNFCPNVRKSAPNSCPKKCPIFLSEFFFSCLGRKKIRDGFSDTFSGTISGIFPGLNSGRLLGFFQRIFGVISGAFLEGIEPLAFCGWAGCWKAPSNLSLIATGPFSGWLANSHRHRSLAGWLGLAALPS